MARPRSFDTSEALTAATQVFLQRGFDGASLEDLTQAMGINKPSLYAAFGDKSALYAKVLEEYAASAKLAMAAALNSGQSLEHAGRNLLRAAVDVYAPDKGQHLGCLIATTATTVAGADPATRRLVATFVSDIDQLIESIIAERFGRILNKDVVSTAATILSSTLYSLAIRARAGIPRRQLLAIAERAARSIQLITRS